MVARRQELTPVQPGYKWTALSVTTLGALMVVIESSIVVLAPPSILRDLNADLTIATWAVNAYGLTLTIFLLPFGRLGDMYGRKRLYNTGFIVFTIGSGLAAFSPNGMSLIAGRLIQGLGGTLIISNSQPIIADAFPPQERGRGIGIQSVAFSVGSVGGFTVGGLMIPMAGWRSIFLINLPVGIFATYWASRRLRELAEIRSNQKHDLLGVLLLASSLTSLLLAGTFGPTLGWTSSPALISALLGLFMIPFFVLVETRAKEPLLALKLFRHRSFAVGNAATFLSSLAFTGLPFAMTFYLQGIEALTPESSALVLAPFIGCAAILGPLSGYICDRWGSRIPTVGGLLLMSLCLYVFSLLHLPATPAITSLLLVLIGIGAGLFFAPNNSSILGAVPADYRGVAAATRATLFNLGRVATIALVSLIISQYLSPPALTALLNGKNLSGDTLATTQFAAAFRRVLLIFGSFSLLAAIASSLRSSGSNAPQSPDNVSE
ncbi:MAG: MFS transporter [Thaumarchaeota archaeon]|nr:MFS transporter [Nitrososphaerota archaeon]